MRELKELRKNKKLSTKEISEFIGVSMSYYSLIENGRKSPSFTFLCKFKDAFPKKSVDKIFFPKEKGKL
jgi:Predicted transcriptional regulator with C-terminal CBS domains